jgi:hypothetical protein
LHDRCLHLFARNYKRKKHRLASALRVGRQPRQTIAAINQPFDLQFQALLLYFTLWDLLHVKQAQPRKMMVFEQPLLHILLL